MIKKIELGNDTGYVEFSRAQIGAKVADVLNTMLGDSEEFLNCRVVLTFEALRMPKIVRVKNLIVQTADRLGSEMCHDKEFLSELKNI